MVGIDPESKYFAGKKAYNAGLNSTNMWEIEKVASYAERYQDIKTLILGLDFLEFSTRRTYANDFKSSGFSGRSLAFVFLERTTSWYALRDSWKTVLGNANGRKAQYNIYGFRDMSHKKNVDHRQLFTTILTENFLLSEGAYGDYILGADRLVMLHNIVSRFLRKKAKVYLFISPVHARQLEAIRVKGLYEKFEDWKRDLVGMVSEIKKENGSEATVELWDFSGYNSITTEHVPCAGSKDQMKWYWESSHYKKATGDLVLARIFGQGNLQKKLPNDFGVKLTHKNIEEHLKEIRTKREAYHLAEPNEVRDVEALAKVYGNK